MCLYNPYELCESICYHNVVAEHGKVLDEFFVSTAGRINIPLYRAKHKIMWISVCCTF